MSTTTTSSSTPAPRSSSSTRHGSGPSPLVLIILAALLLGAWLGTSLFQIQTTEAWVLQGPPPGIQDISWAVLLQAWNLLSGNLAGNAGKAIVVGWVIEIITIVFGVALEITAHGVGKSSDLLKGIYIFAGLGLLFFNGYTDFAYGSLPSGTCGQLFFACVMTFIVVFGLPAGIELLLRALNGMRR